MRAMINMGGQARFQLLTQRLDDRIAKPRATAITGGKFADAIVRDDEDQIRPIAAKIKLNRALSAMGKGVLDGVRHQFCGNQGQGGQHFPWQGDAIGFDATADLIGRRCANKIGK